METVTKHIIKHCEGIAIASFIGSGINGNYVLHPRYPPPVRRRIASFIGSGINGNFLSDIRSDFPNIEIASFIGSGINGN